MSVFLFVNTTDHLFLKTMTFTFNSVNCYENQNIWTQLTLKRTALE